MECPKCGSELVARSTSCPICFFNLMESTHSGAPAGLALPKMPAILREEDYMPAAGIPGLDNNPQAGPQPNYLNPGMQPAQTASSGEMRVSLTGEVIEMEAPAPRGGAGAPLGP